MIRQASLAGKVFGSLFADISGNRYRVALCNITQIINVNFFGFRLVCPAIISNRYLSNFAVVIKNISENTIFFIAGQFQVTVDCQVSALNKQTAACIATDFTAG